MEKRHIAILGSTGSIGRQALDVIGQHRDLFEVELLTANNSTDLLIQQAIEFDVNAVVICNEDRYQEVKDALDPHDIKVFAGMQSVCDLVTGDNIDIVLTSMVGFSGLSSTVAAVNAGKTIALANKESLVVAGEMIMPMALERKVPILPIDSEHSAIFQCLAGEMHNKVEKIILTASGGPFFGKTRDELKKVTARDALRHPNWDMGAKITIDSASMFNKALEIVEARWLFDAKPEQIEVLIHPQSIVHSMIQFKDGAVLAQLGAPDMRVPIAYAMSYPERIITDAPKADFAAIGSCTFSAADTVRFPAIRIAYETLRAGGAAACMMNAANEEANAHFRAGNMKFTDIARVVENTLQRAGDLPADSIEQVYFADELARRIAREEMAKLS